MPVNLIFTLCPMLPTISMFFSALTSEMELPLTKKDDGVITAELA